VEADIAPFRGMLLGLFFMTVGFEIDLGLVASNLPLVGSLVVGLLALKAAVTTLICLAMGLSLANAQQTGLLLSQGGEFAFVAFGMAERLGILSPSLTKLLLTTVAISMATTPALSSFSAKLAARIEGKMGFSHYMGLDAESNEIKEREGFVVVCGYGRIGRLVCDLLDKKFIPYVAFELDPGKAMEARQRGLPVFYGDVTRPEVLRSFNVGKAKSVISTISDIKGANKAVVNIRREFRDLPMFARAKDAAHQKRLQGTLGVTAMVPVLPEDSIMVSLPFGGAFLRSLGLSQEEVNVLLEDTRKKYLQSKGLAEDETDNMLSQLSMVPPSRATSGDDDGGDSNGSSSNGGSSSSIVFDGSGSFPEDDGSDGLDELLRTGGLVGTVLDVDGVNAMVNAAATDFDAGAMATLPVTAAAVQAVQTAAQPSPTTLPPTAGSGGLTPAAA
jgi:voltage-gated potassium channel Kch